jgi:hypothetical protein
MGPDAGPGSREGLGAGGDGEDGGVVDRIGFPEVPDAEPSGEDDAVILDDRQRQAGNLPVLLHLLDVGGEPLESILADPLRFDGRRSRPHGKQDDSDYPPGVWRLLALVQSLPVTRYRGGIGLSGRSPSHSTVTTHHRVPSERSWMLLIPRAKGTESAAAWRLS